MGKKAIETVAAPKAIGPYSQAIEAGGFLYVSGQVPLNPETGKLAGEGIEEQTRQVLANLGAIIGAAGAGFDDVVKTTIFLTDLSHFAKVNEIYGGSFKPPFPARATIQVSALPLGAKVEIEAVVKLR